MGGPSLFWGSQQTTEVWWEKTKLRIRSPLASRWCSWQSIQQPTQGKQDMGLIPKLGKSPGAGNGNPLSILAWKIQWTEESGGLQAIGLQERTWLSTQEPLHRETEQDTWPLRAEVFSSVNGCSNLQVVARILQNYVCRVPNAEPQKLWLNLKFGVSRCKLLYIEWISNKVLLYSFVV